MGDFEERLADLKIFKLLAAKALQPPGVDTRQRPSTAVDSR
jgi:hypothetical protein